MQEHIDTFLVSVGKERGLSANTVAAYRNDLEQFAAFLGSTHGLVSWAELSPTELADFIAYLRQRQYAETTVARKLAAVKSFCQFLKEQGILEANPADRLPSPKVGRFTPRAITPEEVTALITAASSDPSPEGLRDRAMLVTLYATGMRVSELTALNVGDVDLERGLVRVNRNPERPRWVPLNPEAVATLQEYLQTGRPLLVQRPDEPALFLNHRGSRLTRQGFWLILKQYADQAGVPEVTPHTLRHSFALHALSQGCELRELQRILGHVSPATTLVYQQLLQQAATSPDGRLLSKPASRYNEAMTQGVTIVPHD
jgi:integrase/recombinase XerD